MASQLSGVRALGLRRLAARTLMVVGALLLCIYVVGQLHAHIGARLATEAFQRSASDPPQLPSDNRVDFRLWDDVRIKGYKESLRHRFRTPLAVLRIPKVDLEVPVSRGPANSCSTAAGRMD